MPKKLLTIAGSDSLAGGGQATDLKTFEDCGHFGLSVITCIATVDAHDEFHLENLPIALIKAQLDSILVTTQLSGIKIGLLNSPEVISLVADFLTHYPDIPIVLDPVLAFKESTQTGSNAYIKALIEEIIPLATMITPNLTEASLLSGVPVESTSAMLTAGKKLLALGAQSVLIKGGQRLAGTDAIDLYLAPDNQQFYKKKKISSSLVNGAGCMLASSITANLASSLAINGAIIQSKEYVYQAIIHGVKLNPSFGNVWHNQVFMQKGIAT